MNKNNVLILGGGSTICKGLIPLLEANYNLINISLSNIDYSNKELYKQEVHKVIHSSCRNLNKNFAAALVAYRIRIVEQPIEEIIAQEISLLKTFHQYIVDEFDSSKTVVLGSITGRQIHIASQEAYHYQKDIQRSMVKYLGTQYQRHHINLIEINSCFRKYSKEHSSDNYNDYCEKVSNFNPNKKMLNYLDLSETIRLHLNPSVKISGTFIQLDNGFANIQPL